jgi:methyltransferase (TIGR00027 family)
LKVDKPSRTAWAAAVHRAAHQILEDGRIFADPLALDILGEDPRAIAREAQEHPFRRTMRVFIAARSRFAEDSLAAAVDGGVLQVVVLGAGLETLPYRSAWGERVHFFEVDHPSTQAWKRQRLLDAAIPIPSSLTFVPVDFEREKLSDHLAAAGFNSSQQAFFTWLGVVPYLSVDAVGTTLSYIAGVPGGAHVVFDYSDPPDSLPEEGRAIHQRRATRVAELGEDWRSYFEPGDLRAKLIALGFSEIEDLGPPQIAARYFPHRTGHLPDRGGHLVRASTAARGV